jgi:hypothetical protein
LGWRDNGVGSWLGLVAVAFQVCLFPLLFFLFVFIFYFLYIFLISF